MKDEIIVEFVGRIQHFYERGDDLIVLPAGISNGDNMYPYGKNVKVIIYYINEDEEEEQK